MHIIGFPVPQVMMEDARSAASLGVDGLVLGILNADGTVDGLTLTPFVTFCVRKVLWCSHSLVSAFMYRNVQIEPQRLHETCL